MAKKMLIDATHAEETRVVVVEGNKVEEFDFESLNKRQLAGNIYLAKVTRVEPSLQAAFVDYGGNRHGFLAFSEIHPDYYQIPVADREALLAEEAAAEKADAAANEKADAANATEETAEEKPKSRSRSRRRSRGKANGETTSEASADGSAASADAVVSVDIDGDADADSDAGQDETESTLIEDLPESRGDAPAAKADESADYDTVGAEEPREEVAPRRPRARRYKIQEVIKVRQILLVQVVKEERGNKGAALTTYLSLAGRYCVLMPNTARGGGISRKITQAADRKKLKEIANEITVPEGAGLIIRTAGAKRTKTEIKRDYEYLLRQWEQVRDLTLRSIAPAHIYEEGSLIKRSIRDLYNRDIDEIFVEGESGYREAKDYMKMLMPSHAKNVKLYNEPLPLFSRYQVENYLSAMFNPTVQLKSGGYIVIDVTEALVAVDVNSGRSTKEGSIEETALKTNLEAAEEVARQARLRDLAGLIVIDFIDMDERRNNAAVEKRLKDKLKTDRARIQIGRISGFGLLEMSRQRLRPGMLEATTAPCSHCHGTGRVRSTDSMGLAILRELEEEGVRQRSKEALVTAPVEIVNYLLNAKREHIAMIESRFGLSVRIEADAAMVSPDFKLERFNTATRIVPQASAALSAVTFQGIGDLEDETPAPEAAPEPRAEAAPAAEPNGEGQPKKRRRRRRRKGGRSDENGENGSNESAETAASQPSGEDTSEDVAAKAEAATDADNTADAAPDAPAPKEEAPKKSRSRSRSRTPKPKEDAAAEPAEQAAAAETAETADTGESEQSAAPAPVAEAEPATADVNGTAQPAVAETPAEVAEVAEVAVAEAEPKAPEAPAEPPKKRPRTRARASAAETIAAVTGATSTPAAPEAPAEPAAQAPDSAGDASEAASSEDETPDGDDSGSKPRKGWWSRAIGG
ncbi:Rne/Rng family ribonuclease [Oceanibium sediminis]|uniref:Rne/Rng family ribonuclease n=1 Tax=Oceanibium sediminis TaxID=2026339 RepID=UPI000DD3254B|nr:ribonuclease E/G [Oceanibium sediminis]